MSFFILALLFSLFLLNFSIYFPIVKAYQPNRKIRLLLIFFLLLMTLVMAWGEVLRRIWGINWLSQIGLIWLGTLGISFTIMLLNMLLFLFFRKKFRLLTTISLLTAFLLSVWAIINNYRPPKIIEYDIFSEKISSESNGFRLVLVSELHLMNDTSQKWLDKTIARINDLNPDLVVIAGDLIDEPFERISHLAESFLSLNVKQGTYSVPGNHDYYHSLSSYLVFTEQAELNNLLNENRQITSDITLTGVTDRTAERSGLEEPDVEKAMSGINPQEYVIFLSHQPLYYEEALKQGADLILAGHTHRGQIPPMTFLVELYYRYPYGYYEVNGSTIYTTSGVFTWGPPMRLFSRNEIVVFNLYSGE